MYQAFLLSCLLCITGHAQAGDVPWIAVSKDKKGFVLDPSGKPFVPWGFNYDERIISHGHASPADFWYDQPQHEWVIVLKGAARLQFEDGFVDMKPGDFINIPAFRKHRVDWTTPDEPTVWLGVRYGDQQ